MSRSPFGLGETAIAKDNVKSELEQYEKYHEYHGGTQEARKSNYEDMVNKFYNMVTGLYEYGWGESFHLANRYEGETLRESIKRCEHFIALKLGLKWGMKVLDVGCGIGGPLKEIARFSSASITGLNNNDYQIMRGKELLRSAGLSESCNFVKGDFMYMPFPDNTYDAVYVMEATCHAPDLAACYKEIYRVLKPGHCFASYEWCLTDRYDPNNATHQKIKAEIELGDGLPDIRTTRQVVQAAKDAGFEVMWDKDFGEDSPVPWYSSYDPKRNFFTSFSVSPWGRFITRNTIKTFEHLRILPKGSQNVYGVLEKAADGLVAGGKAGIFTPNYFTLARKPLSKNQF